MADFQATLTADSAGEEIYAEFHSAEILDIHVNQAGHLIFSLIGGKQLDAGTLPQGAGGAAPVRGVDYWTAADIAAIHAYVDQSILGGEW